MTKLGYLLLSGRRFPVPPVILLLAFDMHRDDADAVYTVVVVPELTVKFR